MSVYVVHLRQPTLLCLAESVDANGWFVLSAFIVSLSFLYADESAIASEASRH